MEPALAPNRGCAIIVGQGGLVHFGLELFVAHSPQRESRYALGPAKSQGRILLNGLRETRFARSTAGSVVRRTTAREGKGHEQLEPRRFRRGEWQGILATPCPARERP